jgi:hypothetical protein
MFYQQTKSVCQSRRAKVYLARFPFANFSILPTAKPTLFSSIVGASRYRFRCPSPWGGAAPKGRGERSARRCATPRHARKVFSISRPGGPHGTRTSPSACPRRRPSPARSAPDFTAQTVHEIPRTPPCAGAGPSLIHGAGASRCQNTQPRPHPAPPRPRRGGPGVQPLPQAVGQEPDGRAGAHPGGDAVAGAQDYCGPGARAAPQRRGGATPCLEGGPARGRRLGSKRRRGWRHRGLPARSRARAGESRTLPQGEC